MKKYIALICAILMLLLTACNNQTPSDETPTDAPTQSEQSTESSETTPPADEKNPINTMEKLADVDGVISVTKQTFSQQAITSMLLQSPKEKASRARSRDTDSTEDR